jgi:hypothetical protein
MGARTDPGPLGLGPASPTARGSLTQFLSGLLYGDRPPILPGAPPSAPQPSGGLPGLQPRSLRDYETMAARPRSPNLVDLRFQPRPELPDFLQALVGGGPGGGGLEAPRAYEGGLPLGPGPAPTGVPYPTAPTPYAGTSIARQQLDPTTVLLSNQPPAEGAPAPAPLAPAPAPAYPTPTAEAYGTQGPGPTLRAVTPQTPAEAANQQRAWRRDFRTLDRLLRHGGEPGEGEELGRSEWDPFGVLEGLIQSGAINVGPDWSATMIPLSDEARGRLVGLVDRWRDRVTAQGGGWLAGGGGGSWPAYIGGGGVGAPQR